MRDLFGRRWIAGAEFRPTLRIKVLAALITLVAGMTVAFLALSLLGLRGGFKQYLDEVELSRQDGLVSRLQGQYTAPGGWEELRKDSEAWQALVYATTVDHWGRDRPMQWNDRQGDWYRRPRPPRPPRDFEPRDFEPRDFEPRFAPDNPEASTETPRPEPGPGSGPPSGPPGDPHDGPAPLPERLMLLDSHGTRLAGAVSDSTETVYRRAMYDARHDLIGYLAIAPIHMHDGLLDRALLASQTRLIWWGGTIGIVMALLVGAWLTRIWLTPLQRLAAGTRAVAQGRYDTRLTVYARDEFGALTSDFNAMAARLEQAERHRAEWIINTSHELRTPLAVLRAEIEALQDGVRPPDAASFERLLRQSLRLERLIDDLRLTLSDGADHPLFDPVPIRPVEILVELLAEMTPRFQQGGIEVTLDSPDEHRALTIMGDAMRLQQVLVNLLENSLRYTRRPGSLRVATAVHDAWLTLRFDDSAPCPSEAELPRLFDRFYRADASRSRDFGGSGLGLAICRTLIQAHGGTISAHPAALGGLSVVIDLPLAGRR